MGTDYAGIVLFFDCGNAEGYRRELPALRRTLRRLAPPAAWTPARA